MPQTIAFLGATGGCGLAALKRSLAAGHTCVALCRTPSKLEAQFASSPANLIIKAGNAHDVASVASVLTCPTDPTRMVDAVNFSVGGAVDVKFRMDDPDVCKKAMRMLLAALENLRARGIHGTPLVAVVSTTGISKHGRDVPLAFAPFYHVGLKIPHEDKRVMEQELYETEERFVLVRPSLLKDGSSDKKIRVHVESEKEIEHKEIGYFIARDDVGRWMYDNLLADGADTARYERKAVGITW